MANGREPLAFDPPACGATAADARCRGGRGPPRGGRRGADARMGLGRSGRAARGIFFNAPFWEMSLETPADLEATFRTAVALHHAGRLQEAIGEYRKLVRARPQDPRWLTALGTAECQAGAFETGLALLDRSIAIAPQDALAHVNRANALANRGDLDAALASYDRAIALRPESFDWFIKRANTYRLLDRLEPALLDYDRAVGLKPDFPELYVSRGKVLRSLVRVDEAIESFDRAIRLRPEYAEARFEKADALLLKGDYAAGWSLYEWRWQANNRRNAFRIHDVPFWPGPRGRAGERVGIYREVGFGDFIMFARYLPLIRDSGAVPIVIAPTALVRLLRTMGDDVAVIDDRDALPRLDYQCPIMSLPRAFGTTLDTIPSRFPYLSAPPDQHGQVRMPPSAGRPRVGIAWAGHQRDIETSRYTRRGIPLEQLDALLALPVDWHCLHKEIPAPDRPVLARVPSVTLHESELRDFLDTAELIAQLDLVISIDTSVAHLSAALGKPTWLMLPYASDYRWGLGQDSSPWYPHARLFRQPAAGDWASVTARVVAELASFAQRRAGGDLAD